MGQVLKGPGPSLVVVAVHEVRLLLPPLPRPF
jgi:hypothetical protein